jgi:hypothetical protein
MFGTCGEKQKLGKQKAEMGYGGRDYRTTGLQGYEITRKQWSVVTDIPICYQAGGV